MSMPFQSLERHTSITSRFLEPSWSLALRITMSQYYFLLIHGGLICSVPYLLQQLFGKQYLKQGKELNRS